MWICRMKTKATKPRYGSSDLTAACLSCRGWGLAREFFTSDPSSVGVGAFDRLAGEGNPHTIEITDIKAINRTMRARSKHELWAAITGIGLPWLAAATADLDLILSSDEEWQSAGGDGVVAAALAAACGPGRGVSVATKIFHRKRPRLFPVLDELVVQLIGGAISEDPQKRASAARSRSCFTCANRVAPTSTSVNRSSGSWRSRASSGLSCGCLMRSSGSRIRRLGSPACGGCSPSGRCSARRWGGLPAPAGNAGCRADPRDRLRLRGGAPRGPRVSADSVDKRWRRRPARASRNGEPGSSVKWRGECPQRAEAYVAKCLILFLQGRVPGQFGQRDCHPELDPATVSIVLVPGC